MGLFDIFKSKNEKSVPLVKETQRSMPVKSNQYAIADSSTIAEDERSYYQEDSYYTMYSYPGTEMAQRVIPFNERKRISYPSARGLYVAEILLLEYCSYGKYPKPQSGYPGLWWFGYGIRDVGHALESLEKRGFIKWASKKDGLNSLKVAELKHILSNSGLPTTGKKDELIERIKSNVDEEDIIIPDFSPKYKLTELGKQELKENAYVPYMHKHPHKTTEDTRFGNTFNVWSVNKLFPSGDASSWKIVVGDIEKNMFGVDMASVDPKKVEQSHQKKFASTEERDEMRAYLADNKTLISKAIKTPGDGYEEEMKGIDLRRIGNEKEALVQFYISIGKKFDAPALYREASILLRKYNMYDEELYVIDKGLKNVPTGNRHRGDLAKRRMEVIELMKMQ